MNVEALTRLADKLQGRGHYREIGPVPDKKFDLSVWVGLDDSASPHRDDLCEFEIIDGGVTSREDSEIGVPAQTPDDEVALYILDQECGAAACACGWAGTDPWFKQRGFVTLKSGSVEHLVTGRRDCAGAAAFFGIDESDAEWLFMPSSYEDQVENPLPDDVANRMRVLIHEHTGEHTGGCDEPPAEEPAPTETPKRPTGSFDDWFDGLAAHVRNKAQGN